MIVTGLRIMLQPTCGSPNIKPITSTERAASLIGLGIFSKKINKTYKCLNCKHMVIKPFRLNLQI